MASAITDPVEREMRRAGKEIRVWRLLYAALEREIAHLRRGRRLGMAVSRRRHAARAAQLEAYGVASVDELIALLEHGLATSVAVQARYADQLNDLDGGVRHQFNVAAWLAHVRVNR